MLLCLLSRKSSRARHDRSEKYFIYLKSITSLGLWYPYNSGFFVQAYSDAGLGGCGPNWKNTTGRCQFMDGKLVGWRLKKQRCVSLSTVEAEYIATTSCTSKFIWKKSQLREYGISMK